MEQTNNTNVVMELEDHYPAHDRRHEGWKLTGFVDKAEYPKHTKPKRGNPLYPYGAVPIWRKIYGHGK